MLTCIASLLLDAHRLEVGLSQRVDPLVPTGTRKVGGRGEGEGGRGAKDSNVLGAGPIFLFLQT